MSHQEYMLRAISWAKKGRDTPGGGPFGAVMVKDDKIIAEDHNRVGASKDCTQHAELYVIQKACAALNSRDLSGCILYTSCEPCMMCLGASYWANFKQIYYGASAEDAKNAGFIYSDMFYNSHSGKRHVEFKLKQILREEAVSIWK